MMFAVNLVSFFQLTKEPQYLPLYLLFRGVVTEQTVQPDKRRPGHDAVICNVDQERWEAIVQIVRQKFRKADFPLYQKGKGGWKQI